MASSAFATQRGMAMSSTFTSGGSAESIDVRAHSMSPGHILPTRIKGVCSRCLTWSNCQINNVSRYGSDATWSTQTHPTSARTGAGG